MRPADYQVTVNSQPPVAFLVRAPDADFAVAKVMAGDYDQQVTGVVYPDPDAAPDELTVERV